MRYTSLVLPKGHLGPLARPKRLASIKEAVGWPKGPAKGDRVYTPIYQFEDLGFTVGVEKPGKEAFETPSNENDMLPAVYQEGSRWSLTPSFFDLYQEFQLLSSAARQQPLELIACLLYRSSYMLDHQLVNETWRWVPPRDVMQDIVSSIPNIAGLPPEVFLTLVEVLGLQEDTKYWTLNNGEIKGGRGRTNNLQTCTHLIATFLGRVNIMKFAGALSRNGVAPIAQKTAPQLFPLLKPRTQS